MADSTTLSILKHFKYYVPDNDINFITNFLHYPTHIIKLIYFFLKFLNKGKIKTFTTKTTIYLFIFNF